MGWLAIMLLVAQSEQPILTIAEPGRPDNFEVSLDISCPGHRLRIAGVGGGLQEDTRATIRLNGRPLRGASLPTLVNDLSRWRAIYQFGAGCDRVRSGIYLTLYSAEGPANQIVYRIGSATIRNGQLVEYRPMRPTTAENFYWRN